MSISRPFLVTVLGALLLGATFFAVKNARERTSDDSTTAAQTQPSAEPSQPAGQLAPEEALRAAFSFDKLESARFDADLSIRARGPRAESADIEASGRFQAGADGEIPKLQVNVLLRGLAEELNAGFVSLGDRAYFTRGDVGYEIPRDVWQKAVQARAENGSTGGSPVRLPFDPRSWLRDVESERGARIDGVETVHVSASVDPARAVRDLLQASGQGSPAQPSPAFPPNLEGIIGRAVKRAELDVFVGAEDRILRRVRFALELALPRELRPATGVQGMRAALDFNLSDVNRPQTIEQPERISRTAPRGAFGDFTRGFAQGLALTTGANAEDLAASTNDNPRRLQRALRRHDKVVLFFQQQRGLDDQATAEAIRAFAGRRGVLVLRDDVTNADRYGSLVEELGVNQAPSIVIVDRRGRAHLIEGYVDARSLAQEVADTP